MEQNILQPVLNAFTRDETPANKYLGFIKEPLQVNIQGSFKNFSIDNQHCPANRPF